MSFLDTLNVGTILDELTILEKPKNSKSKILCQCSCGNKLVISIDSLRKKHRPLIKSCGCKSPQYSSPIIYNNETFTPYILTDITKQCIGKQYKYLTILSVLGKKSGRLFCLAKCSCGKEKAIDLHSIRCGLVISCGCYSKAVNSNKFKQVRDKLINTITKNKSWKYIKYDKVTQTWLMQCTNCLKTKYLLAYSAEHYKCSCITRKSNFLSSFIGNKVNWLTIIDVILPEKGITKFKCQCTCGNIEEYPVYYILDSRKSCCSKCYHKYHSISAGGTGIPGEIMPLKNYLREIFINSWLSAIYKIYLPTCCISNMSFSNSNLLNIHHLNAFHNIVSLFNIKTSKDYLALSEEDKKLLQTLLLDIQNGLPMTIEYHKLLHKELGKTPTKEESLNWINNKRNENGLHELQWSPLLNKYV